MLDLSAPEEILTFPVTLPSGAVVQAREPSAEVIRNMVRLGDKLSKAKDKKKAGTMVVDETYEAMIQLGFSKENLKELSIPQCEKIITYVTEEARKKYDRKSST